MEIIDNWANIDLDNHIFCNASKEINRLIVPLAKHFGLDTFNYFKTYNDNSQIRLTNTPEWIKHYLTNKLYQESIFELPPHNYMRNRIIWCNVGTHNRIIQEAAKFDIKHGVTFVEPVEDGCEFYLLGTNFHQIKAPLLKLVEPSRTLTQDWMDNKLCFKSGNLIERFEFLNSLYNYHFTKRELDCVPLLIKGYSAKQIAENLKLSFRTVESYINNIKSKTNSSNKNELLAILYDKFG
jgi:DNA-binding CsgD family transcriptional regulator